MIIEIEVSRPVETSILDNVKNVFSVMKDTGDTVHIDTTEEARKYRKVRDIEKESVMFYQEKAAAVSGELQRQIFLQLADEEARHLRIMENIVEFVSRPEPGHWLENAEWHHLNRY